MSSEIKTTIINSLQQILESKNAIKQALIYKQVSGVTDVLSTYADLIKSIQTKSISFSYPQFEKEYELEEQYTVYYVDSEYEGEKIDGTSWESPFITLEQALNQYGSKIICLKQGQYELTSDIQIYDNDVKIYGGFKRNDPSWQARNPFKYLTIFNAKGNSCGFFIKTNAFNDFSQSPNVVLNGVAVANGEGYQYSGFRTSTHTSYFENCIAINCKQTNGEETYGGGFTVKRSSILKNCVAINCYSESNGGGFWFRSDAKVQGCYALNCQAQLGGGFYLHRLRSSIGSVTDCASSECFASQDGGGLYAFQNTYSSSNYFIDNFVCLSCSSKNHGGSVYSNCENLFLRNIFCFNNQGNNSIIYSDYSHLINCTLCLNKLNNSEGYPIYINETNNTYCLNNLCFKNESKKSLKTFFVVLPDNLIMKNNAGDGDYNFVGQNFIWISEKQIFETFLPLFWYLPKGYNSIADMKNKSFGNFIPKIDSLIYKGYYEQNIVPLYDIYNNERSQSVTIGAFQVSEQGQI